VALAIITSGFYSESVSVTVVADVADGTDVLIYDDESKELLGTAVIDEGSADVTVSPILYTGQRIIAYLGEFGKDTYGSIIVTDSDKEHTGWKTPETVDGQPYDVYLSNGGAHLADVYDPSNCRNISRDMDAIDRVLNVPITFLVRQVESMAGTVQVLIENIENAIGGYRLKFDSDAPGSATSKIYSQNGSYSVKVWGVNQIEADAIQVTYDLVMPAATVSFGPNVTDLFASVDFGYAGSPGQRAIMLVAHSSVPCEFQIDGVFDWEGGVWQSGGLAFRSNIRLIAAGEHTIRARNASNPTEEIARQIKLVNF
jgi:hypothetical protein